MNKKLINELLKLKGKFLFRREGQQLEFKEQFNFAGLADYFRDFAAFANNRGGHLIFGIKDIPHIPIGLSVSSKEQFEKIDPATITGYLLEIFSSDIAWEQDLIKKHGKYFGYFYIHEANVKPIIAKKDEGKEQIIKNGEVYYRYGGRTQKIQFAELENIINKRIEQNNLEWMNVVSKIGKAGPQNAAILDTERGIIERDDSQVLVLDETLLEKLKFVKEGEFTEGKGDSTLQLIGDILPINKIEVIKKIKEDLFKEYPFSATELVEKVKEKLPIVLQNKIWDAIKENDIKAYRGTYSTYVFRNNNQKDDYITNGKLPKTIPSIYNQAAVDFLIKVLRSIKNDK